MRICLFEDGRVADLAPLAVLQPAFELLCGITSLEAKHCHAFAPDSVGYLVRPIMAAVTRELHPHSCVNEPHWLRAGPTVLVNARWIPPSSTIHTPPTTQDLFGDGPFLAICQGEIAYAALTPELLAAVTPTVLEDCLHDWLTGLPQQDVGGTMVRTPHDLIAQNATQIEVDFVHHVSHNLTGYYPTGLQLVGPRDRLFLDPSATIDPFVVIDTTDGPVFIDANVVVEAFTRIAAPCFVGAGTRLHQATLREGCSVGTRCQIRGVVANCIVQGFAEVRGAGSLAQCFVGEHTIIGAGVHVPASCVIGDHTRIETGALLDEYTTTGIGSHLHATGRTLPRIVPAFHTVNRDGQFQPHDPKSALSTDFKMSNAQEQLFRAIAIPTSPKLRFNPAA